VGGLGVVEFVTFHAGRNEQVLDSVECQYVGATKEERKRERELVYNGETLRCIGWLSPTAE
jgi:hypothetical protein